MFLYQDYLEVIEGLPEFDKPSYFGLPENIDRSSQRMFSSSVITQLRILKRPDAKSAKFDKEIWARELGPVLNLWKKLNSVSKISVRWLNMKILKAPWFLLLYE